MELHCGTKWQLFLQIRQFANLLKETQSECSNSSVFKIPHPNLKYEQWRCRRRRAIAAVHKYCLCVNCTAQLRNWFLIQREMSGLKINVPKSLLREWAWAVTAHFHNFSRSVHKSSPSNLFEMGVFHFVIVSMTDAKVITVLVRRIVTCNLLNKVHLQNWKESKRVASLGTNH